MTVASRDPGRQPSPGVVPDRHPFLWLATAALLVAIFARAQDVLVPLALAVLIAFALTPAVVALERRLGRGLAVALVVVAALGAVTSFGLLLRHQLSDLSTQVTRYSDSMRRKVTALRGAEVGGVGRLTRTLDNLVREVDKKVAESDRASPVRVVPAEATAIERIEASVGPVIRPAAKAVVVLVLVLFFLARREDLRDRLIRLLGRRNLSLTTRTLDEAGLRISRFLMVQSLINGGFGVAVTVGLMFIGVPYAPLWGILAAVLRFIPFVGSVLGMVLPAMLAFAQLPGWWYAIGTISLFVGLDLLLAYWLEPMAIGRKTGVSSIAMIVAAIFWAWLWGPVGLLLSTPLTVCLAVLGRQVPRLELLGVLLGDQPPLEAADALYQRLLARDEDEAAEILDRSAKATSRVQALDNLVLPVLVAAERDRARDAISEVDQQEVLRTVRALISNFAPAGRDAGAAEGPRRVLRILGVPARNAADELVWEMLAQLFDPSRFVAVSAGAEALASEVVTSIAESDATDLVCITSFPPGGLAQVKYLCKRLRTRRPELGILVLRAGPPAGAEETTAALLEAGASNVVFTIADAHATVERRLLFAPAPSPLASSVPAAIRTAPDTPSRTVAPPLPASLVPGRR